MDTQTIIQKLLEKIEVLEAIIEQQSILIAEQSALIKKQSVKIAELEKRLGKDSNNSSKPPSSDGLSKGTRTNSLRKKGKNKSGGQQGHRGQTLEQTSTPNKTKKHFLTECPNCAASLSLIKSLGIMKRQVFDLPVPKIEITEHQAEIKLCPCCQKQVTASFPKGVNAPVQYGEVIQSWAVYLQHQLFLPEGRLQETFRDLFGVSLATATLNGFSESLYADLEDFENSVLSKIKEAAVKNLDETGFRVTAQTHWLHVASTTGLTYYHVSPRRKALLEGLKGTVVHDHWKPYYQLSDVKHGLCNQHHLRELKALIEYDKESWARKMQRCLRVALHYRHAYGNEVIPSTLLKRLQTLYDTIVEQGLDFHEKQPVFSIKTGRGRTARRTGHNLVLRLKNYRDDVLRFLTDPAVPFTNNDAERDIRMVKCKQKISGGFRSTKGANMFARIRGFISTARKQGWNIFESIQQVVQGALPVLA